MTPDTKHNKSFSPQRAQIAKSVVINLGSGDLNNGFPTVTAQLFTNQSSFPEQFTGSLPQAPHLADLYRNWQSIYRALSTRLNISSRFEHDDDEPEFSEGKITYVSEFEFGELCQKLEDSINAWLKEEGFLKIERQLRSQLDPAEEIRVIVETNDELIRRLPWHRWNFFQDYTKAEIALSRSEFQRHSIQQPKVPKHKVRILAILGNTKGIDVEEERKFLRSLKDADTEFLVNPSRQEFNDRLWDAAGWDMLFFAGHSHTEGKTGRIYINEGQSLTIEQLEEALKQAIENGLKVAIFNSCDGLGLANALSKLNIPLVMVMREPVPNFVAQEFFKHFLEGLALRGLPLYLAVRQARRKLQGLEDRFPGASWLPAVCQNPAVETPSWLRLGALPPCPYRGLFAFREEDSHLFFGREAFTLELVKAVKSKALVAVVGSSGSGKSSLVFAGLIPRLRAQGFGESHIISFRPGKNPFQALGAAIAPLVKIQESHQLKEEDYTGSLVELDLSLALRQDELTLCKLVEDLVKPPATRLILIADQFEELYTQTSESERQAFLDLLLNAVKLAPAFTLVLTLRADFYGYALSYRPLSDVFQGSVMNLAPMNHSELRSVIEKPAALNGVALEKGLTNKLIDDVWGNSARLPLLEFALTRLWSKQREGLLTHEAYLEIGGVEEALANHAEAVYAGLCKTDRERAQRLFMQLVQPEGMTDATRRLATRDEVHPENWDLVTKLADKRLLVTNRIESAGVETVEIVHEAMIKSWSRLRHWMRVGGEFRTWQEQLRAARRQWENSGGDEGALLRGKPLADAKYWQGKHLDDLSLGDRRFIELSGKLRSREQNNQKRRRQLIISGLVGGLVVALMLVGIAFSQWQNALIGELDATCKYSKLLSASGRGFEAMIHILRSGIQLQKTAKGEKYTQLRSEVVGALIDAVYGVRERNRLEGHSDRVNGVSFSPDGETIASASGDGTIKLWRPDGTLLKTLTGHNGSVLTVVYSRDGEIFASSSTDKTIKIWRKDGTLMKTLTGQDGEVLGLDYRRDGQMFASASSDGTIKLWSRYGKLRFTLTGHSGKVYDVSFSPDGKTIASASGDGTIKLWNSDGTLLKTITEYNRPVLSVSFSPDGKLIAAASEDGTIRLFDADGKLIKSMFEDSVVHGVSFSPDGQTIVSVGGDTTVKLWNLDGSLLQTFQGHQDGVLDAGLSPDGRIIASASADGTIKLWYRSSELFNPLGGHQGDVHTAVFRPDGQAIASVGADNTVKLWHRDGSLFKTLTGHTDVVHGVSFSPDGQTIASASWDKTIKLWSSEGTLLKTLTGHSARVYMASFSPDGQLIASASSDGTIKLWTRDGTLLKTLTGHTDVVHGVTFSPDGQTIASASHDRTVKLWSRDGKLLKTLKGHSNWVHGVSFSPDGRLIASASHDHTVKLWNIEGQLVRTITGHTDKVLGVAFSNDGQMIASSSRDGTVRLWYLDSAQMATLRGHGYWVHGVSFSPDDRTLVSASYDNTLILWNLENLDNLDGLLAQGCHWMDDYLKHNPNVEKRDRHLCAGISSEN